MKKIAAAFLSTIILCGLLVAPALAYERGSHPGWQGRDGGFEHYGRGEHRGFDENHSRWAWNNGGEWRENRDWDNSWYRGDDYWHDPDGWYYRDYDRR
jgi:hypothetical protein